MAVYCTLDECKREALVSNASEDAAFSERIPVAKAQIDEFCGHSFDAEVITDERRFGAQVVVAADGVIEVTTSKAVCRSVSAASVSVDGITFNALDVERCAIDGYVLRFMGQGALTNRGGRMYARLSYAGGYTDLPAHLRQAAATLVAYWMNRRKAPGGEMTAYPQIGQVSIPTKFPPHVAELLAPLIRRRP